MSGGEGDEISEMGGSKMNAYVGDRKGDDKWVVGGGKREKRIGGRRGRRE